jgi:hypothetical protein
MLIAAFYALSFSLSLYMSISLSEQHPVKAPQLLQAETNAYNDDRCLSQCKMYL